MEPKAEFNEIPTGNLIPKTTYFDTFPNKLNFLRLTEA